MKIKILRPVIIKGEIYETGKVFDCENTLAAELCANYKAIKVEEENPKTEIKVEEVKTNKKKSKKNLII